MACAGRFFIWSILLAPTYWETIDEIALRVWPKTQISMERKVLTIPTAAKDSVELKAILPTMAASVKDNKGSEIPEINAGMANLFMFLKLISKLIRLVHNNKMDVHFDLETLFLQGVYSL